MKYPPLFPTPWTNDSDMNNRDPNGYVVPPGHTVTLPGATLRDFFAAHAAAESMRDALRELAGTTMTRDVARHIAMEAWLVADAMLETRGAA
jgi:hypothetical protein